MSAKPKVRFATEADLVAAFLAGVEAASRYDRDLKPWTPYAEVDGWDLLMVHRDGTQVGIQAKLRLNPEVLAQTLRGEDWSNAPLRGPDYRAVLVPESGLQNHMGAICSYLVVRVIEVGTSVARRITGWAPPDPDRGWWDGWHPWCPAERVWLPDYVPDVIAGAPAPRQLSDWKIKAIKLAIILERRGYITRDDLSKLGLSPSRWTSSYNGFLSPATDHRGRWVRNTRTPDFRAQHPRNFVEIEADAKNWIGVHKIDLTLPVNEVWQ